MGKPKRRRTKRDVNQGIFGDLFSYGRARTKQYLSSGVRQYAARKKDEWRRSLARRKHEFRQTLNYQQRCRKNKDLLRWMGVAGTMEKDGRLFSNNNCANPAATNRINQYYLVASVILKAICKALNEGVRPDPYSVRIAAQNKIDRAFGDGESHGIDPRQILNDFIKVYERYWNNHDITEIRNVCSRQKGELKETVSLREKEYCKGYQEQLEKIIGNKRLDLGVKIKLLQTLQDKLRDFKCGVVSHTLASKMKKLTHEYNVKEMEKMATSPSPDARDRNRTHYSHSSVPMFGSRGERERRRERVEGRRKPSRQQWERNRALRRLVRDSRTDDSSEDDSGGDWSARADSDDGMWDDSD